MRRRTLLATAGVVLSAGCSESIPLLDPEETDANTDSAPQSPDGSPESAPTEADDGTATAEPTETTEQTTDTPSEAEREGARVVAKAREQLGDAHANYVAFAGAEDATLLDVTVATQVSFTKVSRPVSRANETLDGLPRKASGQQIEAERRLRGVAVFYDQGVRCHDDLHDAYRGFETVLGRLYSGQTGLVPDALTKMREDRSAAADHLDAVERDSSTEDAAAFEPLEAATYDAKVAQLRQAVTAFGTLPDALSRVKRGLDAFRRGGDAYLSQRYLEARREFAAVDDDLGQAADTLNSLDAPAPMADRVADLAGVADALAKASVDMEIAADTGSRGEREQREAALADAKVHMRESSVAVDRFEIVQRLLDK